MWQLLEAQGGAEVEEGEAGEESVDWEEYFSHGFELGRGAEEETQEEFFEKVPVARRSFTEQLISQLRIITDDEKAGDRGSDVLDLARAGIAVRLDRSEHHMHHKFGIFERHTLLTGSYNWTRAAAEHNEENIVVTSQPRLLRAFGEVFDKLWREFRPGD